MTSSWSGTGRQGSGSGCHRPPYHQGKLQSLVSLSHLQLHAVRAITLTKKDNQNMIGLSRMNILKGIARSDNNTMSA